MAKKINHRGRGSPGIHASADQRTYASANRDVASPGTNACSIAHHGRIDLTQVLGPHPGVWFFFGCIFVAVLPALIAYQRRDG